MDWIAGKSYFIGYNTIDRFDSIIFLHNYFYTWSIGILVSLILPILYIFAPSLFHNKNRTSYFLIICLVCLSNMCCIYIQPYLLSDFGEPNLSINVCRFIVYISTFAKPFGLYLTLLFSIERLCTKFILRTNNHRILLKRFFSLSIIFGICFIVSIKLFEIIKLIKNNQLTSNKTIVSGQKMISTDYNSSDSILSFQYCYRSMNIGTYARILSFYVVQYWFEYIIFIIIILVLLWMIIYQYVLPRFQQRTSSPLSLNTKLYFSLSSSVVLFELILQILHLIVKDDENNNTDFQVNNLRRMLFLYNFRCILLPLIICFIICDPLKQWFYELLIQRPYLDNIDETDHTNTMIDQ
ncbi:unnamed protein product [Adineta steineri]|uniref:Uncharacterized protein n=1 Tax=Adineta steineri TaxID=433720 RepID=A0A819MP50_9BILA|nr:unnamed protein product [Adineta steineri]CAF3981878.1 unnamed protein product [Adineta steineri]